MVPRADCQVVIAQGLCLGKPTPMVMHGHANYVDTTIQTLTIMLHV